MLAANERIVRKVKGASKKQYGFIARDKKKESDGTVAVRARKGDVNVTERGFSPSAWMWHRCTDGGRPFCDVGKRVGRVARSCWRRKEVSMSGRRPGCGRNAGVVLHSVVKKRRYDTAVDRYVKVSVNAQLVEALLDFSAMENAVALEIAKVDPKLKIYDLSDGRKANSRWLHTVGMVWLPVVIGGMAEKLRCVVIDGLTEKLVIGLHGLSFLGASINFSTGDVLISGGRGKKVEGLTMAEKSDELHKSQNLVREAGLKCGESDETSPEEMRLEVCTKSQISEQVNGLAEKGKSRDDVRNKDFTEKPSQKELTPVSGRGRKEGKVNVVSPEQDRFATTTTINISPDHSYEESDGDDEDADESEELERCSHESVKVGKRTHKAKRKKGKKKKGSRKK